MEERVLRAYAYAEPEAPGPHTLYDEVLNPYLNELLNAGIETDERLKRAFAFIERLASSTDPSARDIVIATILPNLIGEPRLALARRYMAPTTRRLLRRVQS